MPTVKLVCLLCLLLLSLIGLCVLIPLTKQNSDNGTHVILHIVHVNDFHARYEATSLSGGVCKDTTTCVGGFARLYAAMKSIVSNDTISLCAGDNFQGTFWYTLFKWNVTQHFINQLNFTAITLGNHEFDDGLDGVIPFLKNLIPPVVVSNINDSHVPQIQSTYTKSIVINRNGQKIGIIGVITKETSIMSSPGDLIFLDESASINAEAERLVREENVFTNIVLSHCGYIAEKQMAKNSTGKISLIVGGHSHSLLYSGNEKPPTSDIVEGPYPTIVQSANGDQVLVVQASAYARYLGNLSIEYDSNGMIVSFDGAPIFLSHDMAEDEYILKELEPWKHAADETINLPVGKTLFQLSSSECVYEECTLGNFATAAMVFHYRDMFPYAPTAVYNAGGLRATIERGTINLGDLWTAHPFENHYYVGEMSGKHLRELFEHAMGTPYHSVQHNRSVTMLQVSGIRMNVNLSKPIGDRITDLRSRCQNCEIPAYEDVNTTQLYRLVIPSFLLGGGDGFSIFTDKNKFRVLQYSKSNHSEIDILRDYINHRSPLFVENDDKIKFL